MDLKNWVTVVVGQLNKTDGNECTNNLQTFIPTTPAIGRYVSFTMKSAHPVKGVVSRKGSLKYFWWDDELETDNIKVPGRGLSKINYFSQNNMAF